LFEVAVYMGHSRKSLVFAGLLIITLFVTRIASALASTPTINKISPAHGPISGGTLVLITGTEFTGVTSVKFGTATAEFAVFPNSQLITAIAPPGSAETVDITVTTPEGTSAITQADKFTYYAVPTINKISPAHGPISGGTLVLITGTEFTGVTSVKFGTATAEFAVFPNSQLITAIAPPGSAETVDITVTIPEGTSAITQADKFTYYAVPTITEIQPNYGPTSGEAGLVFIRGSNFKGATLVKIGRVDVNFCENYGADINFLLPPGPAGTVDVTVTTPGGTSAISPADKFTYYKMPAIIHISPQSGKSGQNTRVSILGSGFTGVTSVKFGKLEAHNFRVEDDYHITANSPLGLAGTVCITVSTPEDTSSITQFTYN
jgi:hypothetical protein